MKSILTSALILTFATSPSFALEPPAQYMRLAARLTRNIGHQLELYAARDVALSVCNEKLPNRYESISSKFTKFSIDAQFNLVSNELAKENITDPDTIVVLKVIMSGFSAGYSQSFGDELRLKLQNKTAGVIQATCDNEAVSATNIMSSSN